MAALFQVSGLRRPEDIADHIETTLHLDRHDHTSFNRYARGSQYPVKGGHPYACGEWVDLAAKVWKDSHAWFCTPLWFILKNEQPTPNDLVACARGLPPRFRDDLLEPVTQNAPNCSSAVRLIPVRREFLYSFTDPMNPWSLGALACAMRRAELAADPGTMRWAGVGIVWAIDYLLEDTDPIMHPPLEELRSLVKNYLDEVTYPGQFQMRAPITEADVARFSREQKKFMDYFSACDFSNYVIGEPPPWIELEC